MVVKPVDLELPKVRHSKLLIGVCYEIHPPVVRPGTGTQDFILGIILIKEVKNKCVMAYL